MAFDATIIHWKTLSEFAAHLQTVSRPAWCTGLTNHNTYRPDETQWFGMRSMETLLTYYRDTKKWSSGPHLFLAAHAPNPADTGIFSLTPLARPGTHAGACNATHIGIESVGDFDLKPPTKDQYTLLIMVNRLIMEHWGLSPASVNVHRDCMPGRTCPGRHLTSAQIRDTLSQPIPRPDIWAAWGAIGKPMGIVETFAIPRAWLMNKKLGRCVTSETPGVTGLHSVAEFEHGIIIYLKARNTTIVEMY